MAEPLPAPGPVEFRVPLFAAIVERMFDGDRWVVLDLGTSQGRTVELLSQFRCRMDIADLPAVLDQIRSADEETPLEPIVDAALPGRGDEPTDLVLCWDLLNYLEPRGMRALMNCLVARSRPGTLMHGLIIYTGTHMPARPGAYYPVMQDRLVNLPATLDERRAPRYSPKALEKYMQGFRAEKVRLLNNGMQEFLFRL